MSLWNEPRTKAADAYVRNERRTRERVASWFDVAHAFDAGMRLALSNPQRAEQEFADMAKESDPWTS